MKKQFFKKSVIGGLLTSILFFSCQKEVDNVKLPETKSKLVIGCFISPQDTQIIVTATRSNPIFGINHNKKGNLIVTDATILISDGSQTILIPFNTPTQQYELPTSLFPFSISPGKTYSLNASTPIGESVSASCTVPNLQVSAMTVTNDSSNLDERKLIVQWQDIPGHADYYRVVAEKVERDSSFMFVDTTYNELYSDGNTVLDDQNKDGSNISVKFYDDSYYYGYGIISVGYDIYLMTIDEEYYKYQKSLDNYGYNNPFSEPSLIYSNIKGGLGIFCASQKLYVRKI